MTERPDYTPQTVQADEMRSEIRRRQANAREDVNHWLGCGCRQCQLDEYEPADAL